MKLEKRDIAEALGLVYNGVGEIQSSDLIYHRFSFNGAELNLRAYSFNEEAAWEYAVDRLLNPLVELLKERL